jgi:hypothetical protein
LSFEYFKEYSPILKIKPEREPVSIIVTTYNTKAWGQRFMLNEIEHKNLRMFMVCSSELEMRDVQSWGQ